MMKKTLLAALLSAAAFCGTAGEFQILARINFEEKDLKQSKNKELLFLPEIGGQKKTPPPYLAMRAYHRGKKSHLHPLAIVTPGADGSGHAVGFAGIRAYTLILLVEPLGKLHAAPDLYAFYKIKVPENCKGAFSTGCWNRTKNRSAGFAFKTKPGWNCVKVTLHGKGLLDTGDLFHGITIRSVDAGLHTWQVDDLAVWQGQDTEKPATVTGIKAKGTGNTVKISWNSSTDNLAVRSYRVYRGTVPNFECTKETCVGETIGLEFTDTSAMRDDYYYNITAVDCADLESAPGKAVRMVP